MDIPRNEGPFFRKGWERDLMFILKMMAWVFDELTLQSLKYLSRFNRYNWSVLRMEKRSLYESWWHCHQGVSRRKSNIFHIKIEKWGLNRSLGELRIIFSFGKRNTVCAILFSTKLWIINFRQFNFISLICWTISRFRPPFSSLTSPISFFF